MRWIRGYFTSSLGVRLTAAFLLGAAAGLALGPRVEVLRPLGDLLIRLLQMLVLPIVAFTVLAGVSAVSPRTLARIGARTIAWYLATALVATCLGVLVAMALRPGIGLSIPITSPDAAAEPAGLGSLLDSVLPANVFAAMAGGNLLAVITFSLLLALALSAVRDTGAARGAEIAHQVFDGLASATHTLLHWVMQYAPVGTFALVAVTFAQAQAAAFVQFAKAIAAVYLAQALVCVGVVVLLLTAAVPLLWFARGVRTALVTAFATGSSAATLPVELEVAERRLLIERPLAAFTLPLGVGIHKIGTAAHLGVVAMFAAYATGVAPSLGRVVQLTMLAFLAAVATPPISGGAFLMFSFIFTQAGLPLALIGVVAAIPLLGKLNTPINSLGRLVITAVVSRSAARSAEAAARRAA